MKLYNNINNKNKGLVSLFRNKNTLYPLEIPVKVIYQLRPIQIVGYYQ
jgi:hypothetical protein